MLTLKDVTSFYNKQWCMRHTHSRTCEKWGRNGGTMGWINQGCEGNTGWSLWLNGHH